jgi:hypothetical protein
MTVVRAAKSAAYRSMSRAVERGRLGLPSGLTGCPHSVAPNTYRHAAPRYSTVHLVFDIFQAVGIAAAVGIRPFLPALAVCGLAAAHAQINFAHTDYAFLQGGPFMIGMAVGAVIVLIAEWRLAPATLERAPVAGVFGSAAVALGALFFAGSLCRGHAVIWPGYPAGLVCAVIGVAATVPLFARVRSRLDEATAKALPFYAEVIALLAAVLSVLAPPVGVVVLALLLWLLIAGRGRGERKYAGLRILR